MTKRIPGVTGKKNVPGFGKPTSKDAKLYDVKQLSHLAKKSKAIK